MHFAMTAWNSKNYNSFSFPFREDDGQCHDHESSYNPEMRKILLELGSSSTEKVFKIILQIIFADKRQFIGQQLSTPRATNFYNFLLSYWISQKLHFFERIQQWIERIIFCEAINIVTSFLILTRQEDVEQKASTKHPSQSFSEKSNYNFTSFNNNYSFYNAHFEVN